MSDPAAPPDALGPAGGDRPAALTPERIDAVLADFRTWLTELLEEPAASASPEPPAVDLMTVVAQVTALRHEVNLQTKAARTATEQTAEALKLASAPKPEADPDEAVKPLMKTLIDIADALQIGLRQAEKVRDGLEPVLELLTLTPEVGNPLRDSVDVPPESRGFWARLFSPAPSLDSNFRSLAMDVLERHLRLSADVTAATKAAKLSAAGLTDGYAMSLRRVERAFPQFGLEAVEVVGKAFDPDTMEAAEAIAAPGTPPGTVVEEVRRGYRWHGKPFRFALVKVAR